MMDMTERTNWVERASRWIVVLSVLHGFIFLGVGFADEAKGVKGKEAPQEAELMTRIDFGNSYITGQTLKSGAIYLLQRKKSKVKSMLTYREDYRKEILESHDIRKTDDSAEKRSDRVEKP